MRVADSSPIAFRCDTTGCEAELHTETDNADAAVAALRAARWGESSKDGVDRHHCPTHA